MVMRYWSVAILFWQLSIDHIVNVQCKRCGLGKTLLRHPSLPFDSLPYPTRTIRRRVRTYVCTYARSITWQPKEKRLTIIYGYGALSNARFARLGAPLLISWLKERYVCTDLLWLCTSRQFSGDQEREQDSLSRMTNRPAVDDDFSSFSDFFFFYCSKTNEVADFRKGIQSYENTVGVMYRSNRSFNMPPPGNPPGIWLFWNVLFKFPPTRAKMPFKCRTLGSIQVIKCPHPGDISQAQKWQRDGGNAFSCRTKSL